MATTNDSAFYGTFARYTPSGKLDMKRSLVEFEAALSTWQKQNEDIKPIILTELGKFGRLGEGTLVNFVLHTLGMAISSEATEQVKNAIKSLESSGRISRTTSASGSHKGRGAGYAIVGQPSVNGSAQQSASQ